MYNITIRYYDDLEFFLPRNRRNENLKLSFEGRRSVKDLVESMGIPHVEVDRITINGLPVGFSYIINDGDVINVYSFSEPDQAGLPGLRPSPLYETKFISDVHLRKLARSMRLMGFDIDYEDNRDDDLLAEISHRENRILLTCDRQLLMRKIVSRGIIIRSRDPAVQIIEVIERLGLQHLINPFTRCIECNGIIENIDINNPEYAPVKRDIPAGVISWCSEYFCCRACHKVYWKGSHYEKLSAEIERVRSEIRDRSTVRQ